MIFNDKKIEPPEAAEIFPIIKFVLVFFLIHENCII